MTDNSVTKKRLDLPLRARIIRGVLTIEIGCNTAVFALENHPEFWDGEKDCCTFKIKDPEKFIKDVLQALNEEREDGSTLITDMLDLAIKRAVEDGSEGVDYG